MERLLALRIACTGALGIALLSAQEPSEPRARDEREPLLVGSGDHVYEWVRDWPRLPDGRTLPYTHGGVAVDSRDRVYVTSEGERAVLVFDADGELLAEWGAELAKGLHGISVVGEGDDEHLCLAQARLGQVIETELDGEVLRVLGVPEASGKYEDPTRYHPTSAAVLPSGELYAADGYGLSWIHRYDRERRYVASFGGFGRERGQLRNPHGLRVETRFGRSYLVVADRENGRLQAFTPSGDVLWVRDEGLSRPCHTAERDGVTAVADIDGVVVLLDSEGKVLARLGENPDPELRDRMDVPVEQRRAGVFCSPHAVAWDSHGNLYVSEWLSPGRVTKLRRVGAESKAK